MIGTVKRIVEWVGPYRNRLLAGSLCSFLATWFTAAPVALTAYYIALILGSPEGRPPFGTKRFGFPSQPLPGS